jgi:hypothetical protein
MNEEQPTVNSENIVSQPIQPARPIKLKAKKKIILGAAIGLVVIIGAITAVLAAGLWGPSWNPFGPSPTKVLERAVENMNALQTLHTDINFNIDIKGEESGIVKVKILADSDSRDRENSKLQISGDIDFLTTGIEMLFGGDVRLIGDIIYFKAGPIPFAITNQLYQMGANAQDWVNKWFHLDLKEIRTLFGLAAFKEAKAEEMREAIETLSSKYPVFKFKKKLASEKIEGNLAYHYLFAVDKENLKPFLVGLSEITREYNFLGLPIRTTEMTEEEKNELFQSIDERFAEIGEVCFDIWISKKDCLLHKIAGSQSFNGSEQEGAADVGWEILFSKFDEPIEINAPESSTNIMETLTPLFQMFGWAD